MIPWYVALLGPPAGAVAAMLALNAITWWQNNLKGRF